MCLIHFNWTNFLCVTNKWYSLAYNKNDRFAFFFETYIIAAIRVLCF